MYRVELLPGSSTHVTPGWTYVPDRGFDPAKAAITPTIGRKRGIRDPGRTDLSSRQTNAIIRHLAELDRENHRDVQIQVPVRQKEPAAPRGTRTKVTSNVRRILQSQKSFRNYLDDEEAAQASTAATPGNTSATNPSSSLAAAAAAGGGSATGHRSSIHRITKPSTAATTPSSLRRSSTPVSSRGDHHHRSTKKQPSIPPSQPQPQPQPPSSRASTHPATTPVPVPVPAPETTTGSPATTTDHPTPKPEEEAPEEPNTTTLIRSEHDSNPLLRSYLPAAPSERIMQALLAEPPLTYHAARAGSPIAPRRSQRHFCCLCGYWGKIRCKNCHARTCGLACYKVHEDSRCGAFF
ncbi:hypothetical protein ASPACDRAFT_1854269 [Aspergillus aculeatus ATCC 16872]|uniref:HIT-type domain-containing protein n=1 Tax=Aspergillus aculeatus (strain ATCC 16872 / CBS 172.66 / WB 5094) TaxID=690307 RepID=A0A1L9X188_ASPA1|nr:uncharacterized protein ASPACDRAFT_1854269 [Aspergillus aculeatus ATCC 16872]OJK02287.1 hypothetical protein ASPACDRAFT_1854269 [Aspergillus aculeatus ATCC 16872]